MGLVADHKDRYHSGMNEFYAVFLMTILQLKELKLKGECRKNEKIT
jgi:hypothetical protein